MYEYESNLVNVFNLTMICVKRKENMRSCRQMIKIDLRLQKNIYNM